MSLFSSPKRLFDLGEISYTRYIRTTDEDHKTAVVALWVRMCLDCPHCLNLFPPAHFPLFSSLSLLLAPLLASLLAPSCYPLSFSAEHSRGQWAHLRGPVRRMVLGLRRVVPHRLTSRLCKGCCGKHNQRRAGPASQGFDRVE